MSLIRSKDGLSNESKFYYGIDIVVHIEGKVGDGENLNQKDKMKKNCSKFSDRHYWEYLFEIYKPKLKCKFKSCGSKEGVQEKAKRTHQHATTVVVAMDRDFDNIKNTQIKSNNILYTYGYSWENDAWNEYSLIDCMYKLLRARRATLKDETNLIHNSFEELFSDLKKFILADLRLVSNDKKAFFNRLKQRYNKYIIFNNKKPPKINKQILEDAFKKREEDINKNKKLYIVTLADCFGHLFQSYVYQLLIYILKSKNKSGNFSKDSANKLIVKSFCKILVNEPNKLCYIDDHYKNEFSRIKVK